QHVGRALPLDELACKLDLSTRQLERLFKAQTGKSPQAFAKQVRLRTAAWLLTSSDRTVADIASSCGFADASHLGREFRKQFGAPPAAYREKGGAAGDADADADADAGAGAGAGAGADANAGAMGGARPRPDADGGPEADFDANTRKHPDDDPAGGGRDAR
ncbi:helix-turn-helix domain-containing protein, partial [Burkholderia pseudomallei]|nr:helix-turn-helix domain-containing protein [Burkholderia pseudomallei]